MNRKELIKVGQMVIVRYCDHVIFRDTADLNYMKPIVREALGWLDAEDSTYISSNKLLVEKQQSPDDSEA